MSTSMKTNKEWVYFKISRHRVESLRAAVDGTNQVELFISNHYGNTPQEISIIRKLSK